jgi:hypothetical protein
MIARFRKIIVPTMCNSARCAHRGLRGPEGDDFVQARRLLNLKSVDETIETSRELRDKYYSLAKACHPDSAKPNDRDGNKFASLTDAYALLSGRRSETEGVTINKSEENSPSTPVFTRNHYWAKMFYGSVEHEVELSDDVAAGLHEAAKLSRGGLDKGGLWDFVEWFSANVPNTVESKLCTVEPVSDSENFNSAAPYTRKKKEVPS